MIGALNWRYVRLHLTSSFCFALGLAGAQLCHAAPPTKKPKPSKTPINLARALDVSDLKLEMAENNFQHSPSPHNLSELVASLEEYLNTTCLKDLPRTLRYDGPPTDPLCVARMNRILEINPDNPVGICLRDGIGAPSCQAAYSNQTLVPYSSSSDDAKLLLDPSLKVGITAREAIQLEEYRKQSDALIHTAKQGNTEDIKKQATEELTNVYDKMLSIACRITVLRLEPRQDTQKEQEDRSITEVRQKLLSIPPELRGEYQEKMLLDYSDELHLAKTEYDKTRLKKMIEMIKNPEGIGSATAESFLRKRYVLQRCSNLLRQARQNVPPFPSPTCHQEGWYSPQCVQMLRTWKAQRDSKAAASPNGTPGPAKPRGMISSF